jgi:polyisoprenoid-binding protein YceI
MSDHRFSRALAAGLFFLLIPSLTLAKAHDFQVDPVHSEVGFKVRHLVAKTPGRFQHFSGTVRLDPENVASTLEFSGAVKTASIDTDSDDRDKHLRSEDFFDVDKYPEAKLVSKSVEETGDGEFLVTADITLRGVTKEVELEVEYAGVATNPFTQTPTTGLEIQGSVNRKDFGMIWNKALDAGGFILGDKVQLEIQLEATVPPQ